MKRLLEAMDSMSQSEKKSTEPKFPGYWKGKDPASKSKTKMVGEENILKDLHAVVDETSLERSLEEAYNNFKEEEYGPEFQAMVKRVGDKAKQGPLKTVWDPVKRVYKNVPVGKEKEVKELAQAKPQTTQAQAAAKALQAGILKAQQRYPKMDAAFPTGLIKEIKPDGTIVIAFGNSPARIKQLMALGGGANFKVIAEPTVPAPVTEYGNAQNPDDQTTTPGVGGSAQADSENDAGANLGAAATQKNIAALKMIEPNLNPQISKVALTKTAAPGTQMSAAELNQSKELVGLLEPALKDPQIGSQVTTLLRKAGQQAAQKGKTI
jgi:hypothetical protein